MADMHAAARRVLLLSPCHPELAPGAAQHAAYDLFEALRRRPGVTPILLAAADDRWPALTGRGGRIAGFDGRPDEFVFAAPDYDEWWHRAGAAELVAAYAAFLGEMRPDVVHLHGLRGFGADLIAVTRRALPAARIVFTLHDFAPLCAAGGRMLRRTDGRCCAGPGPLRCHGCFPDRAPAAFHARDLWMQANLRHVDLFTVPSRFMMAPLIAWGLPAEQVLHVPNGIGCAPGAAPDNVARARTRFGLFGRSARGAGLDVLLDAVDLLRATGLPGLSIELNAALEGDPPARLAAELAFPPAQRLVWHNGAYRRGDLPARMARIGWCLMPLADPDPSGLVAAEARMLGRPVICGGEGGAAEQVRHDLDGLHVRLDDARELADTIRRCATEAGLWERLHANIVAPITAEAMASRFLEAYGLPVTA